MKKKGKNLSTERIMLSITDSLLCKADNRFVSLLTLLDQSAAFDTIDHTILLNRLSYSFGISGTVFKWFMSYLTDGTQFVCLFGRLKLFVFALEIWRSPGFCPWIHSVYPILSTCF